MSLFRRVEVYLRNRAVQTTGKIPSVRIYDIVMFSLYFLSVRMCQCAFKI